MHTEKGEGPDEVVVRGGTQVDGTGGPTRPAHLGIETREIIAIGELSGSAYQIIDASTSQWRRRSATCKEAMTRRSSGISTPSRHMSASTRPAGRSLGRFISPASCRSERPGRIIKRQLREKPVADESADV
jgi:hypothetical protein